MKAKLLISSSSSSEVMKNRFSFNKEIGDCIYRIRNLLRDILESHNQSYDYNQREILFHTFTEQVNLLKELLFKSRVVISEEVFSASHEFKNLSVRYALSIDNLGFPNRDVTLRRIEELVDFPKLNELYEMAIKLMREEMNSFNENR